MRASTLATTRVILDAHLLPRIGEVGLGELTSEGVEALYGQLAHSGGKGGRPLSGATVRGPTPSCIEGWPMRWSGEAQGQPGKLSLRAGHTGAGAIPGQPFSPSPSVIPCPARRRAPWPVHPRGRPHRARRGQLVGFAGVRGVVLATLAVAGWGPSASRHPGPSDKRQLAIDAYTLEMLHKDRAEAAAERAGWL